MSQKTFVEKTKEIGPLTVVLDWSMAKYGVTVRVNESFLSRWQSETYEFKDEFDAQNAFDLAIELCDALNYIEELP